MSENIFYRKARGFQTKLFSDPYAAMADSEKRAFTELSTDSDTGKRFIWNGKWWQRDAELVSLGDSAVNDAFGRLRVSNPETIFDSKQLHDAQPLFWDDQEVSGSGTTSTHSTAKAETVMAVSTSTAGKRVRQTFMRFNYQPGKSQLVFMTGRIGAPFPLAVKEIGIFDDDNGLFFRTDSTTASVVTRSSASGSPVDTQVDGADWNIDRLDGDGPSGLDYGVTYSDFSNPQIFIIDFEWLGVGRVRMGVVVGGQVYYVHEFLNANNLANVYMSTPNLPIRYSIENTGFAGATDMSHICSTVISEGGSQDLGLLLHKDSGSVSGLSTGTSYALIGLRLKSTHLDATIKLANASVIASTNNDQAHWEIILNPTIAGTFTYAGVTNSAVEAATGATANTVTGGTVIDGGFFSTTQSISNALENAIRIGSTIAGVQDEIVLVVRAITNNITVEGSITWRELS